MHLVTEAANWLWLQQTVDTPALARHLDLSPVRVEKLLQQLEDQAVVQRSSCGWMVTPMPAYFFQKKGHSLARTLTMYQRPRVVSQVVGVIPPHVAFLTHSQRGNWWLVCNHQGRIGYINTDALRLMRLD